MNGEETWASNVAPGNTYVNSGLELLIEGPEGTIRFPLCQEKIFLGGPSGADNDVILDHEAIAEREARFFFQSGQLYFQPLHPSGPERPAPVGEVLDVGPYRLTVEREEQILATLEALSDRFLGRVWMLGSRPCDVGRPGRRSNHVALEHPTVSRVQARIVPLPEGFVLQAEAEKSPTLCNGEALEAGQTRTLHDGDVLQFGEVRMRFRLRGGGETAPEAAAELRVYCLGAFEVFLGAKKLSGARWRHQLASFLLARLLLAEGEPIPTERLVEDFWPEEDPDVSRRRLTWHLSVLRGYLRDDEPSDGDWLVRTNFSVCLETRRVWHDLHELQRVYKALRTGQGDLEANVAELLHLQRGPYLDGCYLEWAERLRTQLAGEFRETGRRSLKLLEPKPQVRLDLAQRLLEDDPCDQETYVHAMQANLQLGRPQDALKLFEQGKKALRRELNLEPSIDMLREQQRALL